MAFLSGSHRNLCRTLRVCASVCLFVSAAAPDSQSLLPFPIPIPIYEVPMAQLLLLQLRAALWFPAPSDPHLNPIAPATQFKMFVFKRY